MKNIIYIMKIFDNFPYDDNFDLENFLLNMITKDFIHWCYFFIVKIINIQKKHVKKSCISGKRNEKYKVLKESYFLIYFLLKLCLLWINNNLHSIHFMFDRHSLTLTYSLFFSNYFYLLFILVKYEYLGNFSEQPHTIMAMK